MGYVIEDLPPIPPIFLLIQEYGHIENAEMFRVFNMGIGFCIIAPETDVDQIIKIVQSQNRAAYRIGYTVADEQKHVHIKKYKLVGRDKQFWQVEPEGHSSGTSGSHRAT